MVNTQWLGDEIVRYRAVHDLSQEEFARLCGLTKQTVWAIENGRKNITKLTKAKIINIVSGGQ